MTETEEELYQQEVHKFQVDQTLPVVTDGQWLYERWAEVMKIGHFPTLCTVTARAMSIFHGPHVESSFNTMADILDDSSS